MDDAEQQSGSPLAWLAAAFLAAASAAAAHIGADARWLAAIGAAIVRAGGLPHDIGYAAAPSGGWHDAPALGQLAFHGLESLFGDRGLVAAQAAAVGVALAALVVDLRRADVRDGAAAAVLCALVVAVPAAFFVARAELFSLALFPVLVLLLRSEARARTRAVWLAVPLLALWANLHGGALVGLGVLGAYLVLHRARRAPLESACLLAASCLALLATPALLGSVSYYAGVLRGEAAAQGYGLWAPLSLRRPLDLVFVVVALALVGAAARSRPAAWELALLAAFAVLAVDARRNGLWLVLFAVTPAARAFGRSRSPLVSPRLAAACCVVPAAIAVHGLTQRPAADGAGEALLERAAAAAHGSPILADPVDAERLALRGDRIWIGNPLDAFARPEQRAYLAWLRGAPAGDRLLRTPVSVVVVTAGSAPQERLASDPAFRELARDGRAVVYAARA